MSIFSPVSLDYDFSVVLSADHHVHSDSCIHHQKRELGDVYEPYGGYPSSFTVENTRLHQLWWDRAALDFDLIGQQLGMEVISISSILQEPGHCIPYHRDMFFQIRQRHPDRSQKAVRANIFLGPGKLGHVMQFTLDGQHRTVVDWQSNTGYLFDSEILHLSCNAGLEPKYTLQVSGFYLDQLQ